jgi:hypothetical protein
MVKDGLGNPVQEDYDLWHAERTLRDEIAGIPTHRAPVQEAA